MDLIHAARMGDLRSVTRELAKDGVWINARGWKGATALQYAVEFERLEIAGMLIDHGARVAAKSLWAKGSALHIAARNGSLEMAQLLTEGGANVNACNQNEETPIAVANRKGHHEVADFLRSAAQPL